MAPNLDKIVTKLNQ